MVLNNTQRMTLRGLGLAALCLVSWRGGYLHSVKPPTEKPAVIETAPVKTPYGTGENWRPPTYAEAAADAAAEDHDGDADAFVPIVPSTPQDDIAAAQATPPTINKNLLADVKDVRVVVNTGSYLNIFGEDIDKMITAGFVKAQIENQFRKGENLIRLLETSDNVLVYDLCVLRSDTQSNPQTFQVKSQMRLLHKSKINLEGVGSQSVLAVLWEGNFEVDTATEATLKQTVTNYAAGYASSFVSDLDKAVRDSDVGED